MEALMSPTVESPRHPVYASPRSHQHAHVPTDLASQTTEMLHEMAYVYHLTRRIKGSIVESRKA